MVIDWINIIIALGIFLVVDFLLAWALTYQMHGMNPWEFLKFLFHGPDSLR